MSSFALRPAGRVSFAAGLIAVVGLLAAGCTSGAAPMSVAGKAPPVLANADLTQALAMVPSTVKDVTFMDNAAAKARWGLSAVNGSTPVDDPRRAALSKKLGASAAGSDLDLRGPKMSTNEPWDGTDVDWSASWSTTDGPPVTVYRLRDGLDMNVVIGSLTKDGMTRSGSADEPRFQPASLGQGTFGTVFLSGVTVIASQHLLIAGDAKSVLVPTPGSSLAPSAVASALIGKLPAVDYAQLSIGAASCLDAASLLSSSVTAEAAKGLQDQLAALHLKPEVASIVAVTDDTHGVVATTYQDAAAATADLPDRQKLLAGASIVSKMPYTDYFTATLATEGSTLHYDLDLHGPAGQLRTMVGLRDEPWAFC